MQLVFILALAVLTLGAVAQPGSAAGLGDATAAPGATVAAEDLGVIRGQVVEILKSDKEIRLFLGARPPHHRVTVIIAAEQFNAFPEVDQWQDKEVEIYGEVVDEEGRSRLLLRSPRQFLFPPRLMLAARATEEPLKTTGQAAVLRGQVAEVLRSDKVIRVNLGAKQPAYRSAGLIYPDHFADFPDLDKWVGKPVEISGELVDFPDRPHVLLVDKKQIALIKPKPVAASGPVPTTGERDTIRGPVAEVLKSDKIIRINIGAKAPNYRSSAVIYPDKFEVFEDVERLQGRTVEISGEVAELAGRRQIVLESTNQVAFWESPAKRKQ